MAESKDAVTGTGANSEQIRAEIERTRADMDETFDALEAKLTPGQLLGEVWSLTKGGSTAGASKLWRVAKEYPMPSAVIGLGLGWLLLESSRGEEHGRSSSRYNRDFDRYGATGRAGYTGTYTGTSRFASSYGSGSYTGTTRYDSDFDTDLDTNFGTDFEGDTGSEGRLSSAAHSAKDKVTGAAHSAKHAVSDAAHTAKHAVSGAAHNAKEKASDMADRTRYRASELRGQARYKARQARTGFWEMMESNPLAMGAATLAVGVLAGLAIPSTRKEDELLGETRDHLVDDLKSKGQEVLEKGRQVAEATVDTVKQVAQDEGLTVEGVAEKVRAVGREAKNKVKEEVRNQDLVPGTGNQGQAQGAKPEAGEFSGGTSNLGTGSLGTGSGATAVGSLGGSSNLGGTSNLGGSNLSGGLGGGSNTPSPTVGGVPGESMGSATGSVGRSRKAGATGTTGAMGTTGVGSSTQEESRVEENEPEFSKR